VYLASDGFREMTATQDSPNFKNYEIGYHLSVHCACCGGVLVAGEDRATNLLDVIRRYIANVTLENIVATLEMTLKRGQSTEHRSAAKSMQKRSLNEKFMVQRLLPAGLQMVMNVTTGASFLWLLRNQEFLHTYARICRRCDTAVGKISVSTQSMTVPQPRKYKVDEVLLMPETQELPKVQSAPSKGSKGLHRKHRAAKLKLPVIETSKSIAEGTFSSEAPAWQRSQHEACNRNQHLPPRSKSLPQLDHTCHPGIFRNFSSGRFSKDELHANIDEVWRIKGDLRRPILNKQNCYAVCSKHYRGPKGTDFQVPTGPQVASENILAREGTVMWETAPKQKEMRLMDPKRSTEMHRLARKLHVPVEHATVIYKAFQRAQQAAHVQPHDVQSQGSSALNQEQYFNIMHKLNLRNEEICYLLFAAYAKMPRAKRGAMHPELLISMPDAILSLCAAGVGSRTCQAEASFRMLDEDKNGVICRSELLKFFSRNFPVGKEREKLTLFKQIGDLFTILDQDGGGSITLPEFSKAFFSPTVYDLYQSINPIPRYLREYEKHFPGAGPQSFTLLLRQLHHSTDELTSLDSVEDRVRILAEKIPRDIHGRVSLKDWETLHLRTIIDEVTSPAQLIAQKEAKIAEAHQSCGENGLLFETAVVSVVQKVIKNPIIIEVLEKQYGYASAYGDEPT